jgi:hypothetical protein
MKRLICFFFGHATTYLECHLDHDIIAASSKCSRCGKILPWK